MEVHGRGPWRPGGIATRETQVASRKYSTRQGPMLKCQCPKPTAHNPTTCFLLGGGPRGTIHYTSRQEPITLAFGRARYLKTTLFRLSGMPAITLHYIAFNQNGLFRLVLSTRHTPSDSEKVSLSYDPLPLLFAPRPKA